MQLAEFCKCGSIIINGRCTNKGCTIKISVKPLPVNTPKKASAASKTPAKTTKTRRASKCITYNMYKSKNEEGDNL